MPELELTVPPEDWSPDVELLLELVELVELVDDDAEVVADAVVALVVPGMVAALTATSTPVAAKANIATPAVSRLINRWAPSRAEILDWTVDVVFMP